MSNNKREMVTSIPSFSYQYDESTTVKMERWSYYIDRGRLWFLRGGFNKEELEDTIRKCERADSGAFSEQNCPKHFSIQGRRLDFVKFARQILKFYTGYEDVFY